MAHTQPHTLSCRVYYEDTDAAGVMYYANYLKFAERARTEMLRAAGLHQSALFAGEGIAFVVRRCEIDYKAPAKLDDLVEVATLLHEISKTRFTLRQTISREAVTLAELLVEIVPVNRDMRPVRVPEVVLSLFK